MRDSRRAKRFVEPAQRGRASDFEKAEEADEYLEEEVDRPRSVLLDMVEEIQA